MIFHFFTLIFLLLKVFGAITWSWWLVFTPSIIALAIVLLVLAVGGIIAYKSL